MRKDLYQYVSAGRHHCPELDPLLKVINKCCTKNCKRHIEEHKKSGIKYKIFCRECCNILVLAYITPDNEGLLDRCVEFVGKPSERFYSMYKEYIGINHIGFLGID